MDELNPYSAEIRYSLDLLSYYALQSKPEIIRIATFSTEIARAITRRLSFSRNLLLVENRIIQKDIHDYFDIETRVRVHASVRADTIIFPFSDPKYFECDHEENIAIACQNSLSYKSLLYPLRVGNTIYSIINPIKKTYNLKNISGLYSPGFIFYWSLAKLIEKYNSAWYFQLENTAMQRLIHFGPLWRFSYLVVFAGQLKY